jgi:hypothetical protein
VIGLSFVERMASSCGKEAMIVEGCCRMSTVYDIGARILPCGTPPPTGK